MKTLCCGGAAVKKEDEVGLLECLVRSSVIEECVGACNNREEQSDTTEAAGEEGGEAANELKTSSTDDEADETRSSRSPTQIPASSGGQ